MKRDATQEGGEAEPKRRRRFTEAYRRQVVEETFAPGASIAGIALKHRLNANLVFTWRRKLMPVLAPMKAKSVKLLPVTVTESTAPAPVGGETIAENRPRRRGRSRGAIEIEINGARLLIKGAVDAQALRVVLQALVSR